MDIPILMQVAISKPDRLDWMVWTGI